MYRYASLFLSLMFVAVAANAMPIQPAVHTWYAGTTYTGEVNTSGLLWKCSGRTCVLKGPYGTGLNMDICKELSRKVGGLEYYYNDAGMVWSKSQNKALLDQCNS